METKTEMRKRIVQLRKDADVSGLSERVLENLLSLLNRSDVLFVYISQGHEVCTYGLIRDLLARGSLVTVPKIISDGVMLPSIIENFSELCIGTYGIPTTMEDNFYSGKIDACIVPGVAFTEEGFRLGRGKGFYDRFLSENQSLRIALSYEFQILPELPHEEHDVRMDYIVTPSRVICTKK